MLLQVAQCSRLVVAANLLANWHVNCGQTKGELNCIFSISLASFIGTQNFLQAVKSLFVFC